jgi:hypothetical protein
MAVAFPFGDATAEPGDKLSARYAWQWLPIELGLGAKPLEELYIGGYLSVGVGAEGDDLRTERRCEAGDDIADDVSCSSSSVRLGLELRYTFAPAERLAGWIGYGAGFTSATQTISDAGRYSESSTAQGVEWARLTGGLDLRVSKGFGLGPFGLVSVGRFGHRRTEVDSRTTFSGSIAHPAFHAWLALGLRLVIFP